MSGASRESCKLYRTATATLAQGLVRWVLKVLVKGAACGCLGNVFLTLTHTLLVSVWHMFVSSSQFPHSLAVYIDYGILAKLNSGDIVVGAIYCCNSNRQDAPMRLNSAKGAAAVPTHFYR